MTTQDMLTGFGMALLAGAGALFLSLQPQINEPDGTFRVDPNVRPTGAPSLPLPLRKEELIIQQNVNCWLGGQPGKTCGPERTYI